MSQFVGDLGQRKGVSPEFGANIIRSGACIVRIECLNTLWAACMRSAGFFLCRLRMERMRLELNGGILYADLETFCFFAALV